MVWFTITAGIGLIWGIYTDNVAWGLILGAGLGLLIDFYVSRNKNKK